MREIKIGLTGELSVVTDELTASALGSGLVPALATPAMIALMENASVNAIREYLEAGETSVGIEVNVKHLAATPVGMLVRARAEVLSVDKRRVTFRVEHGTVKIELVRVRSSSQRSYRHLRREYRSPLRTAFLSWPSARDPQWPLSLIAYS